MIKKLLLICIIATLMMSSLENIFAISNSVVGRENYPGKIDIKNVNGLGKNISNDLFTGNMTFQYPMSFPRGARGLVPNLTLSYNSNNTDAFSPYGYGFSLSLPRIQRSAKKGVSELYVGDEYAAFGNDLIKMTTGVYRSKDASDMNLYMQSGSAWIVRMPDGKRLTFGSRETSRIADPSEPMKIYAWLLDSEIDPFENQIIYSYKMSGGQPLIDTISYGFNNEVNPLYTIIFTYKEKTASLISYKTQFPIETKNLLSRVTLAILGDTRIRGYEFFYDALDTPVSHLTRIREFSGLEYTPPITFAYGSAQYVHSIISVDNSRGGKATFEYAPSTTYRTLSGELLNTKIPFIVQTLIRQNLEDTVTGVRSTESFSYENGNYYYDPTDLWGREYVGFAKVTVTDDDTRKSLFFHQSQTAESNPLKFEDHIAKKGRIYKSEIWDKKTDKILSTEYTRYAMRVISPERRLVYPAYKTTSVFNSAGSHKDTGYTYTVDDFGNVTEEARLGEITLDLETGAYTDITGDTSILSRKYLSHTGNHLYGFVSSEKITGYSGETLTEKSYEYDGLSSGLSKGLLTKKSEKNVISSGEISEEYVYDLQGLLREKKDAFGNRTISTYDDGGIALISSTNPLSWTTSYTYDYVFGKPSTVTNQNNVTTQTIFDIWGREKEVKIESDGTYKTLSKTSYDDISIPNRISQEIFFDPSEQDKKTTIQYQDGWGRIITTLTSTEKSGQWSRSDVRYDDEGNPVFASYPIFRANSDFDPSYLSLGGSQNGEEYRAITSGVSYLYDPIGRIRSQRDARGMTSKSYNLWKEAVTDAKGNTITYEKDAYENLIKVIERFSSRDFVTSYFYDALSRPIALTDSLGNTRSWTYDGYGRLALATDLHVPGDTTFGKREYTYDSLGRMLDYINAKNEIIYYTYDPLGRVTTESYSGGARNYFYDEGVRSLGMLSRVIDPASTVSYSYDPLGRKISETRALGNENYSMNYEYNTQNILKSITYPDGGETNYIYRNGYIEGVDYTPSGKTKIPIISDIVYAPNATMKSIRYGNGVVKNTERDTDYNYRLSRTVISQSGGTLLDTSYSYDPVSNITGVSVTGLDPLRKTLSYSYDDLSRLSSAVYSYGVSGYGREQNQNFSYTYDDIGNITSASPVGSYTYGNVGSTNPHAVIRDIMTNYFYDTAGNMIERTGGGENHRFAYSPYAEMLSSETPSERTDYTYDHTRRRLTKSSLGLLEHHVIDGYEVEYESGALVSVTGSSFTGVTTMVLGDSTGMIFSGSLEYSLQEGKLSSTGSLATTGSMSSGSLGLSGSTDEETSRAEVTLSGSTGTGSTTDTGSLLDDTMASGSTDTGPLDQGGVDTESIDTIETSPVEEVYSVETNTPLPSGETLSIDPLLDIPSTEEYIVIASYYAATASGAIPVVLTTKLTHIMLGDEKIATYQSQTDDTPYTSDDDQLIYHIADHLNSSSLDLSATGALLQATDYQPFGKTITYEITTQRVKGKKGGYRNKYLFANKQLDEESRLQYFEKRYYDPRIGRFTTEDPVFWEVGLTKRPNQYFTDPQQWNSYSYVRNNPVNMVDPTGEFVMAIPFLAAALGVEGVSVTIVCTTVCTTAFVATAAAGVAVIAEYTSSSFYKAMEGLGSQIYDLTHKAESSESNSSSNSSQSQSSETTGTALPPPGNGGGNKDNKDGKGGNKNTGIDFTNLREHFQKHGKEFGATTESEYAQRASNFMSSKNTGSNILQWTRSRDGAILKLDIKTGNFGIINKNGSITTFYKNSQALKDVGKFVSKNK